MHTAAHYTLWLQFQRFWHFLLLSIGTELASPNLLPSAVRHPSHLQGCVDKISCFYSWAILSDPNCFLQWSTISQCSLLPITASKPPIYVLHPQTQESLITGRLCMCAKQRCLNTLNFLVISNFTWWKRKSFCTYGIQILQFTKIKQI